MVWVEAAGASRGQTCAAGQAVRSAALLFRHRLPSPCAQTPGPQHSGLSMSPLIGMSQLPQSQCQQSERTQAKRPGWPRKRRPPLMKSPLQSRPCSLLPSCQARLGTRRTVPLPRHTQPAGQRPALTQWLGPPALSASILKSHTWLTHHSIRTW